MTLKTKKITKSQMASKLQKYPSVAIFSTALFLIFNVFFCFITPCYSDPIENQDNTGNNSFDDLHSTINFSKSQFRFQLTIDDLCEEISKDVVNIPSLKARNNNIDWLNELLKVPDFYDILCKTKPRNSYSEKVMKLENKTRKYRKKNFSYLSEERQFNIKKLNRLLLEETYPQATPKNQKYKQRCEECYKHLLQKQPPKKILVIPRNMTNLPTKHFGKKIFGNLKNYKISKKIIKYEPIEVLFAGTHKVLIYEYNGGYEGNKNVHNT